MSTNIDMVKNSIKQFKAVLEISFDHETLEDVEAPEFVEMGWLEFKIDKSELGWRTLEFISWVCEDMKNAGERIKLFPSSPPPYLNTPGDSLIFNIEIYPKDNDSQERFENIANHFTYCYEKYWSECTV